MKNLWNLLIFSIFIVFCSCNTEPKIQNVNSTGIENQILDSLKSKIENLEKKNSEMQSQMDSKQESDLGNQEKVKHYRFIDTLDISDNFYVYDRNVEIIKTSESDAEKVLANFVEYKSTELNGVEVLVVLTPIKQE